MDAQGNAVEPEDFDDRYYCEHGTFIGNPFGGDYMCGWCEDGVSMKEYITIQEAQARRIMRRNAVQAWYSGFPVVKESPTGFTSIVVGTITAMAYHCR